MLTLPRAGVSQLRAVDPFVYFFVSSIDFEDDDISNFMFQSYDLYSQA
jgi:hypothetical protein